MELTGSISFSDLSTLYEHLVILLLTSATAGPSHEELQRLLLLLIKTN